MKKISSDLYILEPMETVTINIEAVNTMPLASASIDGHGFPLQPGAPFVFHASSEKGTNHYLVLAFDFTVSSGGAYHVNLTGDAGGTFKFTADQSSGQVLSRALTFRVGSAEVEGKLGIDPPMPWPTG